jgi:hypothetical protein
MDNYKTKGNYHGQSLTMRFLCKASIKPSDNHQLSAICGNKVPAHSTLSNLVWSLNTGKKIAQKKHKAQLSGNTVQAIYDLIMAERHITFHELKGKTGLC